MKYKMIDSGAGSAEDNMSCDTQLLKSLDTDPQVILHHYDWKMPSLTYGYFVNPADYLKAEGIQKWTFDTARRPTGGGIILHTCDLAFSLLIPASHAAFSQNTLANYCCVNRIVINAIERFCPTPHKPLLLSQEVVPSGSQSKRFCMAHPTRYDVMLDGRKVGGAAQRRTRAGLLHQGSICLTLPQTECLQDLLAPNDHIITDMLTSSYPLLGHHASSQDVHAARAHLRASLNDALKELI